jgi:hypothetical protein
MFYIRLKERQENIREKPLAFSIYIYIYIFERELTYNINQHSNGPKILIAIAHEGEKADQ